jgi:hypothetical protein
MRDPRLSVIDMRAVKRAASLAARVESAQLLLQGSELAQ